MDDAQPIARRTGGSIEPTDRDAVLKAQLRVPEDSSPLRFELRDPFSDVTHRSTSLDEMVATADRLGAFRFTSVAPDGTRSSVVKENGQWRRTPVDRDASRLPKPVDRPVTPAKESKAPKQAVPPRSVEPDLASERAERAAPLEAELSERYLIRHAPLKIGDLTIGQTEYRHKVDPSRIAFTESTFKLSTEVNSPTIARSMVDVAEARHWAAVRVSGSDDFRRLVWLEAELRGIRVIGHEPTQADRDRVTAAQRSEQTMREQPVDGAAPAAGAGKPSARGGGRKAVLAALEAVLVSKRVPDHQRVAVMAAAEKSLARRQRQGESHRIKVYDPAGRSERSTSSLQPVQQRTRDRGSLTR